MKKQVVHHHEDHSHSIYEEFMCHFPYAVFSVAFGLIVLTFMSAAFGFVDSPAAQKVFHESFHSFHYLHIVFAGAGTILTFFSYSRNYIKGLIVGTISPMIFCVLSDIVLPYFGGRILGVPMKLHICFVNEFHNIVPFLIIGIITGLILSAHGKNSQAATTFTRWAHMSHILVSSMASMFYMVSNGYADWTSSMGLVFIVLIVAVVIPCTLSDVVVPMMFAKTGNNR